MIASVSKFGELIKTDLKKKKSTPPNKLTIRKQNNNKKIDSFDCVLL